MKNTTNARSLLLGLALVGVTVAGCGDGDNRTVTKEEAAAADTKRQSYIDTLNIPADQKAKMKAQMGGPPVADPAAGCAGGLGRRRTTQLTAT